MTANQRINLTRPSAPVGCDRSPRRLCAVRWTASLLNSPVTVAWACGQDRFELAPGILRDLMKR